MLKKGSKLNSILTGSCPKCHEESMYFDQNPYNLKIIYKMQYWQHCLRELEQKERLLVGRLKGCLHALI